MYKIVFVDDERYILDKIPTAVDWNEAGFELTATFSNAKKAMEYIKSNHVDLLITDIKMPNISGIDLAKFCYENFPEIRVIVLSAYENFEYAKTLMRYNVKDYISKPLLYSDISNALKNAKTDFNKKKASLFSVTHKNKLELQQIFSDIFYNGETTQAQYKKLENNFSIDAEKCLYQIRIISIHNFMDYFDNIWKHPIEKLYSAIDYLIPYESKNCFSFLFRYFLGNIEFIIVSCQEKEFFENVADKISQNLKTDLEKNLNISCEIQISEKTKKLSETKNEPLLHTENNPPVKNEIIEKAVSYIKSHYSETLSLMEMAKYVNLSYKYFGYYFKTYTGKTFKNYVNSYRLEKATELMYDESLTITTICEMVGFGNKTHFYDMFKRKYGLNPNEYRKKLKHGGNF